MLTTFFTSFEIMVMPLRTWLANCDHLVVDRDLGGLGGIEVGGCLAPVLGHPDALDHHRVVGFVLGVGPRRLAEFLYGREDANLQADAAAFVRQLLEECSR